MFDNMIVIEWTANLLHWTAPYLVRPRGRTSAPHLWAQLSSIFWPFQYPSFIPLSSIHLLHSYNVRMRRKSILSHNLHYENEADESHIAFNSIGMVLLHFTWIINLIFKLISCRFCLSFILFPWVVFKTLEKPCALSSYSCQYIGGTATSPPATSSLIYRVHTPQQARECDMIRWLQMVWPKSKTAEILPI